MASFKQLFLKCHDASVFAEKNNHALLQKIFYDDYHCEQILSQDQYFIIGEKGTGKTIIAQYLSRIRTDKNCSILDFSTIDFDTFRRLHEAGHLKFIQADQLWQVLLLVIAAEAVVRAENGVLSFGRFKRLKELIDEFYDKRFVPEFPVAVQLIERIDQLEKLSNTYIGEKGGGKTTEHVRNEQFANSPLNSILRNLIDTFGETRVSSDHVIFVDKIDVKPDDIEFDKFIQGLRSFARAALYLNENVFAKMKGTKRIKFVLLVRPDIFDRLNLQNQSARASDNSVVLNWDTTYEHHRTSTIFMLTDQFIGKQSGIDFGRGQAWDYFIKRDVYHFEKKDRPAQNMAFREFLRLSWFRPRDIIRALHICQQRPECAEKLTREVFERSFKDFSEYLFGEVKDFSRFYFSDETFALVERFFSEVQTIDDLDYDSFLRIHEIFLRKISNGPTQKAIDARIADPDEFLQILYSSNIVCWRAENDFGGVDDHWAFRERSATQLEPKVGLYCKYGVHYGLRRALRLNRSLVRAVSDSNAPVE